MAKTTTGAGNGGCKLVSSSLWVFQDRHFAVYMAAHHRLGGHAECLLSKLVSFPMLSLLLSAKFAAFFCCDPAPKLGLETELCNRMCSFLCVQDGSVLKMIVD